MPLFAFTVTDTQGERSSGTVMAPDREGAERMLAERNLVVTRLSPVNRQGIGLLERMGLTGNRWRGEKIVAFTQQLAALTEAGLNPKAALDLVIKETRDSRVREILMEMSGGLAAGHSLTEILGAYPTIFSSQYVAMVAAGESSGKLPVTLDRLAAMIERSQALRSKLRSAFYYPALLLTVSAVVMGILFAFGIPRFKLIYEGFGGQLPTLTVMLMNVGTFLGNYWSLLLLLVAAVGFAALRYVSTSHGRRALDRAVLRTPVLGNLMQRLAIARFARTLGSLHSSGVSMILALELVAESVGNTMMADAVRVAQRNVVEGEPVIEALGKSGHFTDMALSMMTVGEQTGSLDVMLNKIADYYENQVDISLRALTGLLEPAILVGVGVTVGVVIFAMVLPVFRLVTLLFER